MERSRSLGRLSGELLRQLLGDLHELCFRALNDLEEFLIVRLQLLRSLQQFIESAIVVPRRRLLGFLVPQR